MGNKVGDTFLDLCTFTAHSNELGDTFYDIYTFTAHCNRWASFFQPNGFLIWDIQSFSRSKLSLDLETETKSKSYLSPGRSPRQFEQVLKRKKEKKIVQDQVRIKPKSGKKSIMFHNDLHSHIHSSPSIKITISLIKIDFAIFICICVILTCISIIDLNMFHID